MKDMTMAEAIRRAKTAVQITASQAAAARAEVEAAEKRAEEANEKANKAARALADLEAKANA